MPDCPDSLFLGGTFRPATGAALAAVNPATGARFAQVGGARPEDAALAVAEAARAFPTWRATTADHRATILDGFAAGLEAEREALIALQMTNNGKPRLEAEIDLDDAAACFRHHATLLRGGALEGRGFPLSVPGLQAEQQPLPLGPAALIVPWNFPLVTTAWKLAPALAAGCTAVLKPSEHTTLAELAYGRIAQALDLPPGVLSILPGAGDVAQALLAAPGLRKISFTGSNATGARVMAQAAARTLPVSLELGGKSPILVLEDADIDAAADLVMGGAFFNAGQMCSATSRVIVAAARADDLIAALRARIRRLAVGDPGSGAQMGPLTTEAQRDRVLSYLLAARAEALDCLAGGTGLRGSGFFVEPTLYLDVPPSSRLWREEIFGPVLCLARVADDAAAIALANDCDFGLAATVVGGCPDRARTVARGLDAGHVWVNTAQIIPPDSLWGGFKASGIGRELGAQGLMAYCATRHLTLSN